MDAVPTTTGDAHRAKPQTREAGNAGRETGPKADQEETPMPATATITKSATYKPYQCLDCRERLTESQFLYAMEEDEGCPNCGSVEIDIYVGAPIIEP